MGKGVISENFSRYAHLYDRYSSVQQETAQALLEKIPQNNFLKILELGSGTGNLTMLLRERFKHADIKAVDISEKMIECAHGRFKDQAIKFIHADAERLDLKEKFDLITSNACFHWFDDLENALRQYKRHLQDNGLIVFTLFGPDTFYELNFALGLVLKGAYTASSRFSGKAELVKFLKHEFKKTSIDEGHYQEEFPDLTALLKKIKYSGTRGSNAGRLNFSRRTISEIEKSYLDKFGLIKATYQVFFCRVQK